MTIFKGKSLEGFISFWLTLFAVLFLLVVFQLMWQLKFSSLKIALTLGFLAGGCGFAIVQFRNKVTSSFQRALMHLEAVSLDDYKQYAKAVFPGGVVGKFHHHLRDFSDELATKKHRYDQHAFLIYQLIDQLNTPVLVFNQKDQLTYANGAFSQLYQGQHWQMFRHASPKLLDLVKDKNGWQLLHEDKQQAQQWQISQSTFIDAGVTHQLLVFTNIELAVRTSQVKAWRQMISVMGHEIRNSLTPVSTIAESLVARASNDRDKSALALISERCLHLQDFINRYASLSNGLKLHCEHIDTGHLTERLVGLFTHNTLLITPKTNVIWADQSLLEQVLINLTKNAFEAGAEQVKIEISEDNTSSVIRVIDDGHGFANPENAFVPLYSTKQEGQGLGLSLCRNIIEQHAGKIILTNNKKQGVTVSLALPLKKPKLQ